MGLLSVAQLMVGGPTSPSSQSSPGVATVWKAHPWPKAFPADR